MQKTDRHSKPVKGSSDRTFGIVMAVAFAFFGVTGLWKNPESILALSLLGLCSVFLLLAMTRATLLRPLNVAWTRFGHFLHTLVSPVIMALLFYLLITPIGILIRLSGKDMLRLKRHRQTESYWLIIDQHAQHSDMKKQF